MLSHRLQVIKLISQVIADFADGEIDQSMHRVRLLIPTPALMALNAALDHTPMVAYCTTRDL